MSYITRTLSCIVMPPGSTVFSDDATVISIDDDAAGEFVVVAQHGEGKGVIALSRDTWPTIREAIDKMINECQE